MKPDKIVLVEWIDSFGSHAWIPRIDAMETKPSKCYSVGYLLKEDENYIVLSQSYDPQVENVGNVLSIPVKVVISMTQLRKK